jgi:uncharacterized protein (TIGR03435 family)
MTHLQRRLYSAVLRLHPAAFRDEFGREMALDFEDALRDRGFAALFGDAILSLGRQWAICLASSDDEIANPQTPSLLDGNYVMIRNRSLNPLEWARGLLASIVLLALCISLFGAGSHTPANTGVVYAAMQAIANPQDDTASPAATPSHQQFTQFDVATIRENRSSAPAHINFPFSDDNAYVPTHGYMQASGLPLGAYIQFAYRMNPLQVVAFQKLLPDWAVSARYDIEARVEGDPGKDDIRRMVRALLASRFKLQLHTAITTADVYDLKLVHPGKLGPSLHVHAVDDPECRNNQPDGFVGPCGAIRIDMQDPNTLTLRMTGRNVTLDQLLFYATTQVGRPVLNKTGLTGRYDFTLAYASVRRTPGDLDIDSSEPLGPSFPDAVHDQLGLKLVLAKGPVTTYVLDHIEKPSPN